VHPSPLRSMILAGLSLVTAAVATVGALYEAPPTVVLRTDPAPAAVAPTGAP